MSDENTVRRLNINNNKHKHLSSSPACQTQPVIKLPFPRPDARTCLHLRNGPTASNAINGMSIFVGRGAGVSRNKQTDRSLVQTIPIRKAVLGRIVMSWPTDLSCHDQLIFGAMSNQFVLPRPTALFAIGGQSMDKDILYIKAELDTNSRSYYIILFSYIKRETQTIANINGNKL